MKKQKELRVLHLTLHKAAFDAIADGYKTEEYRKPRKWIKSRLEGKEYDAVLFVNGYGRHRPWMLMEFKGHRVHNSVPFSVKYLNRLKVQVEQGDYVIEIGRSIDADYRTREKGQQPRPEKFFTNP
jgi:hypothetical protein